MTISPGKHETERMNLLLLCLALISEVLIGCEHLNKPNVFPLFKEIVLTFVQ